MRLLISESERIVDKQLLSVIMTSAGPQVRYDMPTEQCLLLLVTLAENLRTKLMQESIVKARGGLEIVPANAMPSSLAVG